METSSRPPTHTEDGTPISDESVPRSFIVFCGFLIVVAACVLTVLAILIGILYGVVVLLDKPLTAKALGSPLIKIAICVAMNLIGMAVYRLKASRFQIIYGLGEVAIGLMANWRTLDVLSHQLANPNTANTLFTRLAILGAGVYLIGRGISNAADGFRKLVPIPE